MIDKVGILTFHASHNFGSMLQAYALLKTLHSLGVDAEDINLRIDVQQKMYDNPLKYWGPKSILERLKHPKKNIKSTIQWYRFEKFLNDKLRHTTKTYKSWEQIQKDLPYLGYKAIITGGDQIWNTCCIDFDKSYYLPSELPGIKKIAYSPSMGGDMHRFESQDVQNFIKENLGKYNSLSVRDEAGSIFLTNLLGKSVPTVADPTLLLSAAEWSTMLRKCTELADYLFYYSPFDNDRKRKLAEEFSKKYGLPIITPTSDGPVEFLRHLANAKFVCGHSYHLAIFALLLHKEFAIFNGDKDERIKGLLKFAGAEDRGVSYENPRIGGYRPLNYQEIDARFDKIRAQGIEYLTSVLNIE